MYNAAEVFRSKTGADMTHVPFRGGPDATAALISGEIELVFAIMSDVIGQLAANTIRPLAISTSMRSPILPEVPTMIEQGVKDYDISLWNGLFAPLGTPKPIIDELSEIMLRMPQDATVQSHEQLWFNPGGRPGRSSAHGGCQSNRLVSRRSSGLLPRGFFLLRAAVLA